MVTVLNDTNQFTLVKNCKDSIGLFQTMPDVEIRQVENHEFEQDFSGEAQFKPEKMVGLVRVFYEGALIRTAMDVFGKKIEPKMVNQTTFYYYDNYYDNYLKIAVKIQFSILPPGNYFLVTKVTDMTGQLFLDSYTVVRVRHSGGVEIERRLVNEYRNEGKDKEKFLGLKHDSVRQFEMDPYMWGKDIDTEWIDYRVQHVKRYDVKNIRNLK